MSTIYIDRPNTTLTLEKDILVILGKDKKRVPLYLINDLIITCHCNLQTRLIRKLTETGIRVLITDPMQRRHSTFTVFCAHNDHNRKAQQYSYLTHDEATLPLAINLVQQKILSQIKTLNRLEQLKEDSIALIIKKLKDHLHETETRPVREFETLRGIEGGASRLYFTAVRDWLPEHLMFTGRNKRPPKDPVNACLSLAYTLLYHQSACALQLCGLDPGLGFMHAPQFNRLSLACDLTETLRADVDYWILKLFHERWLQLNHFAIKPGACMLNKTGRGRFFWNYEQHRPKYHRYLIHYGRYLWKHFAQE